MFAIRRLTAAEIEARIDAAASLPQFEGNLLSLQQRGLRRSLPCFFAHDTSESILGRGEGALKAAKQAFRSWMMFALGWVRVANPAAEIAEGQLVAVEARTLGLWSLNISRIISVIDTPTRFGFIYATTRMHVEEGDERFLLEINPASGAVIYTLEAVSRPRHTLARLGWPITRAYQRRFARDSLHRMRQLTSAATDTLEA